MNKPNFFIIGAAKCGTTALSEYLRKHENIHMSWPKEPHYFAFDLGDYRYPKGEKEYLALFDTKDTNVKIFGEASVFYLYSDVALQEIKQFSPDAKIVVLFRNPADMLYSLHSQLLYSRDEVVEDFAEAWKLCETRKAGKEIPKTCRDGKILYYDELARFGAQYQRVLDTFGQDQVRSFLFDDFVRDPKQVYDSILDFLDLPNDNRQDFEKVNERRGHKIKWLSNLTQRPPAALAGPVRVIKNAFGINRLGVLDFLRQKNLTTQPRKKLSRETKRVVISHYREDIILLQNLTGRDLSAWLET